MATRYNTEAERPGDVQVFDTPHGQPDTFETQRLVNVPQWGRGTIGVPDRPPTIPGRVITVLLKNTEAVDVTPASMTWQLDLSSLSLRPGTLVAVTAMAIASTHGAPARYVLAGLPTHTYGPTGTRRDLEFGTEVAALGSGVASLYVVSSQNATACQLSDTQLYNMRVTLQAVDDTFVTNPPLTAATNLTLSLTFVEPGARYL